MTEQHVDIASADGAMNTFVVHPDTGGPHPVVLFYMDAPGKRQGIYDRDAAERHWQRLMELFARRLQAAQA